MMNKSKNTYTLSILAAGCVWGFMGLFRRYMGEAGFTSSGGRALGRVRPVTVRPVR